MATNIKNKDGNSSGDMRKVGLGLI